MGNGHTHRRRRGGGGGGGGGGNTRPRHGPQQRPQGAVESRNGNGQAQPDALPEQSTQTALRPAAPPAPHQGPRAGAERETHQHSGPPQRSPEQSARPRQDASPRTDEPSARGQQPFMVTRRQPPAASNGNSHANGNGNGTGGPHAGQYGRPQPGARNPAFNGNGAHAPTPSAGDLNAEDDDSTLGPIPATYARAREGIEPREDSPAVRGELAPLIDSLKELFQRDRAIASQGSATRCGVCYLHFAVADLEYREAEGFYVCADCRQALARATLPMIRRQQR